MLPSPTPEATRLIDSARALPGGEDAGDTGFQQHRIALQRPVSGAYVRAGAQEAEPVALDGVGQPAGLGDGPDENEQPVGIDVLLGAGGPVTQCQRPQRLPAVAGQDLGVQLHGDVGLGFQLVDEVLDMLAARLGPRTSSVTSSA